MDKYRMGGTKLMWHLDRLKDWYEGKTIVPINIIIGITSRCNLNCCFCYGKEIGQTDKASKSFEISIEDFRNLVRSCEEIGVRDRKSVV